MPITHHLTGPGELIATLPQILNKAPNNAVVVVGMNKAGAVVTAMSADRDYLQVPDFGKYLGEPIADALKFNNVNRVILVTFTDEDVSMGCDAVEALRPHLEKVVDISDVWASDGERFWAPGCADHSCCPPQGNPLPKPTITTPFRASVSAVGHAAPARDDVSAPAGRRRSAASAADRWSARRHIDEQEWRVEGWTFCGDSCTADATPPLIGRAIASLQDLKVRDAVIVEWLGGAPDAVADTLLGFDSDKVTAVLDNAMRGTAVETPETAEIISWLDWCKNLIAHARKRDKAPMLTLSAVALWWGGDLVAASDAARQALGCDPDYSLAHLISDICEAKVTPAWQRK